MSSRAKSKTIEESKITWHGPRGFDSQAREVKKSEKGACRGTTRKENGTAEEAAKMIAAQKPARRDARRKQNCGEELMNEKRLARKRKQRRVGGPQIAAAQVKMMVDAAWMLTKRCETIPVTESVWDIMRTWKVAHSFKELGVRMKFSIRASSVRSVHIKAPSRCTRVYVPALSVVKNFSLPKRRTGIDD